MRVRLAWVAVGLACSLAAGSALAQQQTDQTEKPKRSGLDPNQVVCEKQDVLGSRLQSRRVCMTRAQWAEKRQLDRQNIERNQTGTCQRQAGC